MKANSKPRKVRVIWRLTRNRTIEKIGAGAQQIFVNLSRDERQEITLNCLSVKEHPIY